MKTRMVGKMRRKLLAGITALCLCAPVWGSGFQAYGTELPEEESVLKAETAVPEEESQEGRLLLDNGEPAATEALPETERMEGTGAPEESAQIDGAAADLTAEPDALPQESEPQLPETKADPAAAADEYTTEPGSNQDEEERFAPDKNSAEGQAETAAADKPLPPQIEPVYYPPEETLADLSEETSEPMLDGASKRFINSLSLDKTSFEYTGSAIYPNITVKDAAGNVLKEGVDYTAEYLGNINVGTAAVNVVGIGECSGSSGANFWITAAGLGTVTLSGTSFPYTGNEVRPAVTVKDKAGKVLSFGSDYNRTYSANINVGTATVTITGMNNYSGTVSRSYTITPASLTEIVLGNTSYLYTGSAIKPRSVVRSAASLQPEEGSGYTLSYQNNVNVGTGTVMATGKGNYQGTVKKTFEIVKGSLASLSLDKTVFSYTGSEIRPVLTVKDTEGNVLVLGKDYTAVFENNINAGQAVVNVYGAGNYGGSRGAYFTISKEALGSLALEYSKTVYTGSQLRPKETVKSASGKVLTAGKDYSVAYDNNIRIGTATVTVTGMNNYSGTLNANFSIALPFTDVAETAWYYEAVSEMYMRKVITGTTATTFSPKKTLNRAQFATFLWRYAGEPQVAFQNIFPDVKNGNWYSTSVIWANQRQVVTGYGNGTFGPMNDIQRQQACVILMRYAQNVEGRSVSARTNLNRFSDAASVSSYAKDAVSWAVATGLMNGKDGNRLDPKGTMSRSEAAAILYRYSALK